MSQSRPDAEDRIVYAIISIAAWLLVAFLLAAYLLSQGYPNWATGLMAVGLALGVYAWFGKGPIAHLARFPGRLASTMF